MNTFDPSAFEMTPVAVVDEFRMTDDLGGFLAQLDERYLVRLCEHMNAREMETGDLTPIVIGHTKEGEAEVEGPQVVGFGRNWRVAPFFDTGRKAAFCDAYIYKVNKFVIDGEQVFLSPTEVAKRWPRRSAEVWTSRYEIDPISLLGSTTPARDLGLMRFSRSGSLTFFCPGDPMPPTQVPGNNAMDSAVAGQSSVMEEIKNLMQQMVAGQAKLLEAIAPPPAPAGAPPTPGGPQGAPGQGDPGGISDEELEDMLRGTEGGEGDNAPAPGGPDAPPRKGEKPVQNSGYPGGSNTAITAPQVKLSQEEFDKLKADHAATRNELNKLQLSRALSDIRHKENIDINPDDPELINDLAAMPPDIRLRQLDRIKKLSRQAPVSNSFHLEAALLTSTDGSNRGRRVQSAEDVTKVIQLARSKGVTYEAAASELGYEIK